MARAKKAEATEVIKPKRVRRVGVAVAAPTEDKGTLPAPTHKASKKLGTLGLHKIGIVSVDKVFVEVQKKELIKVVTADGCSYLMSEEDFAAQYNAPSK